MVGVESRGYEGRPEQSGRRGDVRVRLKSGRERSLTAIAENADEQGEAGSGERCKNSRTAEY